jgi:hypothetical protein
MAIIVLVTDHLEQHHQSLPVETRVPTVAKETLSHGVVRHATLTKESFGRRCHMCLLSLRPSTPGFALPLSAIGANPESTQCAVCGLVGS